MHQSTEVRMALGSSIEAMAQLDPVLGGVLSIFIDVNARLNFSESHPVLEVSSRSAVKKRPYPRKNATRWSISRAKIIK